MAQGGIKTAPLLTEMIVDLTGLKSGMKEASNYAVGEADSISRKLSSMNSIGEGLSKFGSSMTKYVTTPIIGAGTAVTKMAVDFESNFAKVSTLLDENVVDYGTYKNEMLQGSSDMKVAIDEYSDAVYNSISAGVDQRKAVEFTNNAMKLAKGGFTDASKAVDVLTTAINAYGYQATDATMISDLLITTQNLGKTTVDELASSMGKVIPTANAYNVGIKDVTTALADLTKNGIATAEATTYYNSMLNELGKAGTGADTVLREKLGKSFSELQKEGVPLTECLKVLKADAEESGKSLADMFGSAEAAKAALTIMKDDGVEYNEILQQMEHSAGATQEAFEKIDATPAEQLKGAVNRLKNSGIQLGQAFIPIVEKVADKIGDFADALANMSEEEMESAIKMAGFLAAVGPVSSVVGGAISTVSKLGDVVMTAGKAIGVTGGAGLTGSLGALATVALPVTAVLGTVAAGAYAVHEHSELMNSTILKSSDEMSWLQKVMADVAGVEVKTREELEAMGLVHKEFSENISPEFQKAVEDSTKELQDFNIFMRDINMDDVLTEEELQEFGNRVDSMCDNAIAVIDSKKEESTSSLREMFTLDDGVLSENESKVLSYLQRDYELETSEIQQLKDEIYNIRQRAIERGTELDEAEIQEVQRKLERIKQLELEAQATSQEEQIYAKTEFLNRVQTMDLESSAALLMEKAAQRDENILGIKTDYDTQIKLLESHLDRKSVEESIAIMEEISRLNEQKNNRIQIEKDMYDEYMDIAKENNEQAMQYLDEYSGKILTNEELHSRNVLKEYKSRYKEMNTITQSGTYLMKNTVADAMEAVTVVVDENTGDIVGAFNYANSEIGAANNEIAQSTSDMAAATDGSFDMIAGAIAAYVDNEGNVRDASDGIVGALQDVKTNADGTRTGILDLNGTPIEVKTNADGVIMSLQDVSKEMDSLDGKTVNTFINTHRTEIVESMVKGANAGKHYNGLDNVPYDGYQAILHKNERVLTAEENAAYNNPQPQLTERQLKNAFKAALAESNLVFQVGDKAFARLVRNAR